MDNFDWNEKNLECFAVAVAVAAVAAAAAAYRESLVFDIAAD